MRLLLACMVFVLAALAASGVLAQTGTICLYADPQGTQCSLTDTAPGLLSVYVIHAPLSTPSGGVTGAQFAAPKPECMTGATWVTDLSPGVSMNGSSQTGVTLTYGRCITEPAHVLTIQYMVSGMSQTDCAYRVTREAGLGVIEVATCDFEPAQGVGGLTYINSSVPCECSEPTGPPVLSVSSPSIDFGESEVGHRMTIWNDGGGVLTWNIAEAAPWLTVIPTSGTGYAYVGLTANRSGLPLGVYTTEMVISSNGGTLTVPVAMEVGQVLSVYPESLTFEVDILEEILQVRNAGPESISWTVSWDRTWLSASPAQGVGSLAVRVRVNRAGLAGGTYTGSLTVSGGGEAIHVPVTMKVAAGQSPGGAIGVFSDPQASGCNLFDRGPGLMTAYIVHVLTTGATASQFAAPMPTCMTGATYLGETSPFLVVLGTTQTGVAIGYARCLTGPILLLTVQYFVQGMTEPCCAYPVIPDLAHGYTEIETVDCGFTSAEAVGASSVINPDASCQCASVKTAEATWGKIKSMYSDE